MAPTMEVSLVKVCALPSKHNFSRHVSHGDQYCCVEIFSSKLEKLSHCRVLMIGQRKGQG